MKAKYYYFFMNVVLYECLSSAVHLLTGLCDPTLCLLHRAVSGVTKDRKKEV